MGGKQNLTLEVNITFRVLEFNSTRPIYSISTRQPIPGVGMRVSSFPLPAPPEPAMNEHSTLVIHILLLQINSLRPGIVY